MHRYAYFVQRHFLWLLLGCYALAAIWPAPGVPLRQWDWSPGGLPDVRFTVPLLLLAMMLFSAALLADVAQIRAVLQQPLLLCVATLAVWIGPALLVILASYLVPLLVSEQPASGVLVGLTLAATMPVANSLNAPAMQVCESVPKSTSPGRVWPLAGSAAWHTPA